MTAQPLGALSRAGAHACLKLSKSFPVEKPGAVD